MSHYTDKICYLYITSWVGLSIGASHSYGELRCAQKTHKLERILSTKDAITLNKIDRVRIWKQGDTTNRYDSEKQLVDHAKELWQTLFPDAIVLIQGSSAVLDPQPVLMAPKPLIATLNSLVRQAKENGYYENDPDRMDKISNEWMKFLKEKL